MSWWNAKYTNNDGEYEIAFASNEYEKAKAVEKVCCAVMDSAVKSPMDVEVVVRCRECKYHNKPPCPMKLSFNWTEDDDFCSYGEREEGV